ncbi:MAG: hypothetical protein S4CHLAM45_13550 [Chlamydiales bacterium]|nr:hypothetical protein [Chlamydiales bacterium]MCH9620459.1 hypothetical protein [Chlamydiales bacterium]MCH9623445.1 hypothetical protein [Chlamydiales bacterium]
MAIQAADAQHTQPSRRLRNQRTGEIVEVRVQRLFTFTIKLRMEPKPPQNRALEGRQIAPEDPKKKLVQDIGIVILIAYAIYCIRTLFATD